MMTLMEASGEDSDGAIGLLIFEVAIAMGLLVLTTVRCF
jgi:hypothetical protein